MGPGFFEEIRKYLRKTIQSDKVLTKLPLEKNQQD